MTENVTPEAKDSDNLSDYLTVKVGEDSRDLFMSYGLLASLAHAAGEGVEGAFQYSKDYHLQQAWIQIMLAELDENGQPKLDDPKEIAKRTRFLSISEAEKLIDWVGSHVINFTMRRMKSTMHLAETNRTVLEDLQRQVQAVQNLV